MATIISRLWNGKLEPIRLLGTTNHEIKNIERLLDRNSKKLKDSLNETSKELLEKYDECITEYLLLLEEQAFCDGFCLGARITAEALIETEQQT